ncbi:YraN family protein [Gammaproteobacteria bacterium]|nr:YraN family protein [Gammaproteobacteria bacterium]
MKISKTISLGIISEKKALNYLIKNGLKFITKNYKCYFGEIDLIMQDYTTLVFIEVRLRYNKYYGNAIESIDSKKQKKLLKSATHYLQKYNLTDKIDCRFDVIGFSSNSIDWIKDAFSYE